MQDEMQAEWELTRDDGRARTIMFVRLAGQVTEEGLAGVRDTLLELTPLLDQEDGGFYLDLTGCEWMLGAPAPLAARLAWRLPAQFGVPVAIGLAHNKWVAFMAGRQARSGETREVLPADAAKFLAPLPISLLPGWKPEHLALFREIGWRTMGHIAEFSTGQLKLQLGEYGVGLVRLARGMDVRAVGPATGRTVAEVSRYAAIKPTLDEATLRLLLLEQTSELCRQLRVLGKAAILMSIALDLGSAGKTHRQKRLPYPLDAEQLLMRYAWPLLQSAMYARRVRVRGLRLTLSNFQEPTAQMELLLPRGELEQYARLQRLNRAIDQLRERHGAHVVQNARSWAASDRRVRWAPLKGRQANKLPQRTGQAHVLGFTTTGPPEAQA